MSSVLVGSNQYRSYIYRRTHRGSAVYGFSRDPPVSCSAQEPAVLAVYRGKSGIGIPVISRIEIKFKLSLVMCLVYS